MDDLIKAKEEVLKKKKESLFCSPFYGDLDTVLFELCKAQLKESLQHRNFIALTQASMSGKTRLLLELSLLHPLIIIAFKRGGPYNMLMNHLRPHTKICDSFEERLFHNRNILLKIRLFLLSYLKFYEIFLNYKNKTWNELDIDDKKVLNMMLLNGGGKLICNIFEDILFEKCIPTEYNEDNHKTVDSLKEHILEEYLRLSNDLGYPWLAFDECHVPTRELQGKLFHSDYKNYSEKQIMEWQQYEEMYSNKIPTGYPYKMRTSLFSGFRWILEELVIQPQPILSLFASTKYSCWGILADSELYSREKPKMKKFEQQYLLTKENILDGLKFLFGEMDIDVNLLELDVWKSRPGFFFDCAWSNIENCNNQRDIEIGLQKGKEYAFELLDCMFVNHKEKDNILRNILYFDLMCGSHVTNDAKREDIISSGLGIYSNGHCIVQEPIIREYLELKLQKIEGDISDVMIENQPIASTLAEYAVALQIIKNNGNTLMDWIKHLYKDNFVTEPVRTILSSCVINVKKCCSLDYALKNGNIENCINIFDDGLEDCNQLFFPPNSKTFPDVLFVTNTDNSFYCMVSIQHKLYKEDLLSDKGGFVKAVNSVSIDHFFKGHDNKDLFGLKWKTILENEDLENVFHLRIIICWSGFSSKQINSISSYNEKYPFQPILLIYPTKDNVNLIYGEKVSNHFQKIGYSLSNHYKPRKTSLYPSEIFKMDVSEKEQNFGNWIDFVS